MEEGGEQQSTSDNIQVNRVSIYKRLKPETSKLKKTRFKQTADLEFTTTDSSQSNECDQSSDQLLLQEPEEKIKLIERAIGYFNADKDETNQKNLLNSSIEIGPPFVCQICQSWFYLGSKLKVHYILNHGFYHCEICSILFKTFDEKAQHLINFHAPIFCEICQQDFKKIDLLLEHYECVHDSTTCKFCGLLVQPKSLLQQHLSKKHQIHSKYLEYQNETGNNFIESTDNTVEFYCMLCTKTRMIEVMFGHMFSFHKMALTSLMNLLVQNKASIKCDGSSKDVIKCEKEEGELDKDKQEMYNKYFCQVCGMKYIKKLPEEFHLIYCRGKLPCKYCEKIFTNSPIREKHIQKQHLTFSCQQNCENISYNTEENLHKHYYKIHLSICCRYCDQFIPINNYEQHLEKTHKYKAQLMKNFKDTLFEIMDKNNKHIVVCCLCDENITLLTEQPKNIFLHYEKIHQMSVKRILQLCTLKPVLEEYEQLYREINEQIKQENEELIPQIEVQTIKSELFLSPCSPPALPSSNTSSDEENPTRTTTTTTNAPNIIIKKEQQNSDDDDDDEEVDEDNDDDDDEDDHDEETNEIITTTTTTSSSLSKLKDFSHLESEIESDFDADETEAFLNSEFETDSEQFCEICLEEFDTMLELIKHLNEKHKLRLKTNKIECKYCKEKQLTNHQYLKHVEEVHTTNLNHDEDTSILKTVLEKCGTTTASTIKIEETIEELQKCPVCKLNILTDLKRCHILDKHNSDLNKFDLQGLNLKCRFCDLKFWDKTALNSHEVAVHIEENKNYFQKCYKCLKDFSSQKCLKDHFFNDHNTETSQFFNLFFKCLHCNLTYPSIELLRSHFRAIHPHLKIYKCPVPQCFKTTKRAKYITKHLKSPHNFKPKKGNSRTCDVCKKEFRTFRAASIHKLMKHQRKIYAGFQCRICQEKFQTMEQRKLHYSAAHPGQLAYSCLECGKGFISKSGLYGHRKIHQEHETLTCPYCNKEFTRRDSYNEHLLIHIGPRHQCPHCPKSFTQRSNLTRHVRIHTGAKPYQCTYCDKRFSDKGACRSHERVHTKEEHCQCSYCGKKFTKKQKLKYHIKFHTGEGLVNCEVCNKQFSNSYSLNEHRRIHNQQTLVMCNCGRGFTSEKYLQRHIMNVHNDSQAKYVCPICFKTLLHKSSYNDHIMTHTSVKHIKCMLCNHEYNTKKTVKRHLLEKHDIEVTGADLNKYIYQLKPEDVGLNVPSASEMEINVNDLLTDKNLVSIDLSHLQKLETFKNKPKITNPGKRAKMKEAYIANTVASTMQTVQIKEEPKTDDDENDNNYESDNSESEDDVVLERRKKRKVVKPRRYKQRNSQNSEINNLEFVNQIDTTTTTTTTTKCTN